MADIIPFQKPVSKKNAVKKTVPKPGGGHTLCKSGFHKWQADKSTDFAVKQGKLLTRFVCERCGKTKTEPT